MKTPIIAIVLAAVLALGLAGCGGQQSSGDDGGSQGAASSEQAGSTSTDAAGQAFQDATAALESCTEDYVVQLKRSASKPVLDAGRQMALDELDRLYNDGRAAIEAAGGSDSAKKEYLDKLAVKLKDCTDTLQATYDKLMAELDTRGVISQDGAAASQ